MPETVDIRTQIAVTVDEAAGLLGISRSKLFPLVTAGVIRSFKIGRARRIPVREIDAFIERQAQLASSPLGSAGFEDRRHVGPLAQVSLHA